MTYAFVGLAVAFVFAFGVPFLFIRPLGGSASDLGDSLERPPDPPQPLLVWARVWGGFTVLLAVPSALFAGLGILMSGASDMYYERAFGPISRAGMLIVLLLAFDAFVFGFVLLLGDRRLFSRTNVTWSVTHHAFVALGALSLTSTVGLAVDWSWGAVALGVAVTALLGLALTGALTGGHLAGFETNFGDARRSSVIARKD